MEKPIFMERWWLDAVAGTEWNAVTVERGGRLEGWLPFARSKAMGMTKCGLPPLSRLLFPVVAVAARKRESADRARFQIEHELIGALPKAQFYQFVLPPDDTNTLAWQAHGFTARVQHTFVIDPGLDEKTLWGAMRDKTRNLVRRAQESLKVETIDAARFLASYIAAYDETLDIEHRERVRRLSEAAIGHGQGRAISAIDADGREHAAVLFIWDAKDCYFYLATRDAGQADPGAMSLLVWHGILDAAARGLRFDFDGVTSRNRLRFMQPFGGRIASRVTLERSSLLFGTRLMLRQMRHRVAAGAPVERFN